MSVEYATFGKFSQAATNEAVKDLVDGTSPNPSHLLSPNLHPFLILNLFARVTAEIADPTTTAPHTTRKVTQPPGGPSNITISGGELVEEDALSMAPPKGSSGASGAEGTEEAGDGGEGVTYTHTERAEVRSVSVDLDNDERYAPHSIAFLDFPY